MRIEVNGEMRDVEEGLTVRGLLLALELGDRLVAVERNAELVPRTRHETTVLCEGDRVEIVEFVGGG